MYLVKPHRTRIDGEFTHLQPGQQYEPSNWELRAYPDRFSPEPPESAPSVDDYTARELTAIAQEHDVPGYSGLKKDDLFALVREYL